MKHERIVCAAMKMEDGLVVTGIRHFSTEMRETLRRIYGDDYHLKVKEQGFVNQRGTFLSRKIAWIIAKNADQIIAEVSSPGTLYSENLY